VPEDAAPAGPGMFAQSDPSAIRRVLTAAGFADIETEPHTVPMRLGTTITEAVDHLADTGPGRAILETIPPERHADALAAVGDALGAHHTPDDGVTLDAAVLLTTARTTS